MTSVADALAALDAELERVDHPIHRYREPPLTLDQIHVQMGDSHLELPADVEALWLWQSSTSGPRTQARMFGEAVSALPGGMELLTIPKALKLNALLENDLDDVGITRFFLPVLGSEVHNVWMDCSGEYDNPVRAVSTSYEDPSSVNWFESVVDLIEKMTSMLAEDYWVRLVDHTGGEIWQADPYMANEWFR